MYPDVCIAESREKENGNIPDSSGDKQKVYK